MEWYLALILLLGTVCVAMFIGMPVAFAFFATNVLGTYLFVGGSLGLEEMPKEFQASVTKFILTPIALFLLMGEILLHTGVAFKAIGAIDRLIARVPGRLAVVTIAGGTIFSSLSGSSIANTAILGSVLLPDMVKRGYAPTFAMGPIMAVGGIAVLIPPSALAVLLASLADQSIAKLLIAGIIPGLLMALLFFAYVIGRSMADPSLAPGYEIDLSHLDQPVSCELYWRGRCRYRRVYDGPSKQALNRWLPFTLYITPLFMIFVVVVGSIFMKLAAPTEAAALGCVAAFALCYLFRLFGTVIRISGVEGAEFSWRDIWKALMETAKVNTLILFIIAGSLVFTQALESSGATQGLLREIIAFKMTPLTAMFLMMLVLLFMGAFMDQVSMVLLTLPFFVPLAMAQHIDVIYLMVLMLIVMEISLLTPPFGLLLYVMKGVAPFDVSIGQVIRAAAPFIVIKLIVLTLLIVFDDLATWLPSQIR